jgi:hypothetical protein
MHAVVLRSDRLTPQNDDICNAPLPDGSTINRNVDALRGAIERSRRNGYRGYGAIVQRWINNVREGGAWDYKGQPGGTDTQGNANYGATGALLFPRKVLLRVAGFVQDPNDENRGNWWDWGPSSTTSYGDQPRDQEAIKHGVAQCRGSSQ